jgi:hypothetical protein
MKAKIFLCAIVGLDGYYCRVLVVHSRSRRRYCHRFCCCAIRSGCRVRRQRDEDGANFYRRCQCQGWHSRQKAASGVRRHKIRSGRGSQSGTGSQGADLVVGTCDYDFGAPALLQAQKAGKISVFLCAEDAKAGVAGVGPYSFTAGVAAQLEGASLAEWGYDKQGTETSTSFSTTA